MIEINLADKNNRWVVIAINEKAPSVVHATRWAARLEAIRLSEINPDKVFFVAAVTDSIKTITRKETIQNNFEDL